MLVTGPFVRHFNYILDIEYGTYKEVFTQWILLSSLWPLWPLYSGRVTQPYCEFCLI